MVNLLVFFSLYSGSPPANLINYAIELSEPSERAKNVDNYYKSIVLNAVANATGTYEGIRFESFKILQTNPFTFEVKWQNCSLPSDCNEGSVQEVNSIIHSSNNLDNLLIKDFLPTNLEIKSLKSDCENNEPFTNKTMEINITVCGVYSKYIDRNIVQDKEDGSDLKTELKTNNNENLPIDTWINYNDTSRNIYAMPTEAVSNINQNLPYLLVFTDSRDAKAQIKINVTVIEKKKVYYEYSLAFSKLSAEKMLYLDVQIKLFELFSQYTQNKWRIEDFRVMYFTYSGGNNFFIRFAVCLYDETICKNTENEILNIETSIASNGNVINPAFESFMFSNGLKPLNGERATPILNIDQPTNILFPFEKVILMKCQTTCVNLNKYIYDNEQDITSLTYKLLQKDKNLVPKSYWLQVTTGKLCAFPWSNLTVGIYEFDIEIIDKCNSKVILPIQIELQSVLTFQIAYKWTLELDLDIPNEPDVFYYAYVKERLEQIADRLAEDNIQFTNFDKNGYKVSFGFCDIGTIPCNNTVLFMVNNITQTALGKPSLKVQQIFENKLKKIHTENKCTGPVCEDIVINTTMCNALYYKLLDNACKDTKYGNLRNLTIELIQPTQQQSWIRLNTTDNTIYGYPIANEKENKELLIEEYTLKVTNEEGISAFTKIYIYIRESRLSANYQIQITGNKPENKPFDKVDAEICLTNQLKEFYHVEKLHQYGLTEDSKGAINVKYGFCDTFDQPCNCTWIQKTQHMLQTMRLEEKISRCMTVLSTMYQLNGNCQSNSPPQLTNGISEIRYEVGKISKSRLPSDQFVDAEDGPNRNLALSIRDLNNLMLMDLPWLNLYDNQLCGLIGHADFSESGYSVDTILQYKIFARDACGKENFDRVFIKFRDTNPGLKYRVYITLLTLFETIGKNCSEAERLYKTIQDYANVNDENIYVERFSMYNDSTANTTGTTINIRLPCEDKDVNGMSEKFNDNLEEFKSYMLVRNFTILTLNDNGDDCHMHWWWWLIIAFLILLFLLLLFLLLWCLIPRYCPVCSSRNCPCCSGCCTPNGCCSSYHPRKKRNIKNSKIILQDDDQDIQDGDIIYSTFTKEDNISQHSSHSSRDKLIVLETPRSPATKTEVNILPLPLPQIENDKTQDNPQTNAAPTVESWTDERPPSTYRRREKREGKDITDMRTKNNKYENNRGNRDDDFYYVFSDRKRSSTTGRDFEDNKRFNLPSARSKNRDSNKIKNRLNRFENNYRTENSINKSVNKLTESTKGVLQDSFTTRNNRLTYERRGRTNNGYRSDDGYYGASGRRSMLDKNGYRSSDESDVYRKESMSPRKQKRRSRSLSSSNMSRRYVHATKPVSLRVRRSILRDYLRSQGRSYNGKVSLDRYDIRELLGRNATLKLDGDRNNRRRVIRSNSKLADALLDDSFNWNRRDAFRTRRYSMESVDDNIYGVDQKGRMVSITPTDMRLTLRDVNLDNTQTRYSFQRVEDRVPAIDRNRRRRMKQESIDYRQRINPYNIDRPARTRVFQNRTTGSIKNRRNRIVSRSSGDYFNESSA